MTIRHALALAAVLLASLAIAAVAAACGGANTYNVIKTSEAQNKVDNATATSAAVETAIAKGEKPVLSGDASGGQLGIAGALRATAVAAATATAAAGGSQSSALATATPSAADVQEAPPGDPLTGEVMVKILSGGKMDPSILKVKVGTTVTWENTERANHTTASDPGQAESWDSGPMARLIGDTVNRKFSHAFTKAGRYTYRSNITIDEGDTAVVFVVE